MKVRFSKNLHLKNHPTIILGHQRLLKCLFDGKMEKELRNIPLIHIAGTKGKGTTAAFAESILRQRGLKTALFTSPHLVSVCERYF